MQNVNVTKVSRHDIDQLQKIGRQTFEETYAAQNTKENMAKYLAEGFSTQKLTDEVTDPNAAFYFAILNHSVIGYLKINFGAAQTELKDNKALEIERIYVLKEWQGQKIGQVLYEKAVQIAKQTAADYIWLGVWEQNPKAMEFYQKNGFVEFNKHIFKLGDDEQTDIMMKLQIC